MNGSANPVTVVTGSNSGIGRATAVHLAAQGHEVWATMRNLDSAAKLTALADEAGVEVRLAAMDIANDGSVRRRPGRASWPRRAASTTS